MELTEDEKRELAQILSDLLYGAGGWHSEGMIEDAAWGKLRANTQRWMDRFGGDPDLYPDVKEDTQ